MGDELILVTGALGQDGFYLCKKLAEQGARIVGGSHKIDEAQVRDLYCYLGEHSDQVELVQWDVANDRETNEVLGTYLPSKIFNFASMSSVSKCENNVESALKSNVIGANNLFLGARKICPDARIFQASSSEIFGYGACGVVNESSQMRPKSFYGQSKLMTHTLAKHYRDKYGQFISCGILFNHESKFRTEAFVSKKIVKTLNDIKSSGSGMLRIGRLDIERDWSYAGDVVNAAIAILNLADADDFVVGSGECHSIRDFVTTYARCISMDIEWVGTGLDEVGVIKDNGQVIVSIDTAYYRDESLAPLIANSDKLKSVSDWNPEKNFHSMMEVLVG